ncbi:MAG TPA: nitrate reductase subunit beta [Candidatus Binatia bacterium]|nr:nitrate reductase subunit beta [Candidatus Binatia bacterium]
MDVRAQIATVFHLDKCLGCHTCSVACKNIWTDRKGAEYMWWNNVETKPGTGYPTLWEDQEKYRGGWEKPNGELRLRSQSRTSALLNIFHNPSLPSLDDYYEPWTYDYQKLTDAPPGDDQPTARPISMITGRYMDIEAGPNWDDDLAGSPVYASQDPNWAALTPEQSQQLFAFERLVFFHLPRTCNHCLNPACVAACPSGALHKRGEDGLVLIDQDHCRGWRHCVAACPYKKTYFNWEAGRSEKCILCFPRLETAQAPACFHSCPGRIRFVGVLLYDAGRILEAASAPQEQLIDRYRDLILDPSEPEVVRAARACGIPADVIEAAQRSPVFSFVKLWRLALPLHIEFRTLPTLFYVPPLSPVVDGSGAEAGLFSDIEHFRIPLRYLASLFAARNEEPVRYSLRKQQAVRQFRRAATAGDIAVETVASALAAADCNPDEAGAIYRLTTLSAAGERFVIPPLHRELTTAARESMGTTT